MTDNERFMGALRMVPIVRELCGGDCKARKLMWRLYFEDWKNYKGSLEEKSTMLRESLGQHLGIEVPEVVEIRFWHDKRDNIDKLLAEIPKAR